MPVKKWFYTSSLVLTAVLLSAGAVSAKTHACLDARCHYQGLTSLNALDMSALEADATIAKRYGSWGFDVAGMNKAIKPGNDFFDYANGKALDAMVIPADRASYGSFNTLSDLSELRLKTLIEALAQASEPKAEDAQISELYNSMMNEALVQKLDIAPMVPSLRRIDALNSKSHMATYMGQTMAGFGSSFFGAYIYDDAKNPKIQVLYIGQGGLGLPDRDYYLDAKFSNKLLAYKTYVAELLRLSGYADAAASAKAIVALETRIAKVSWTRIDQRDDNKTYNPMTRSKLITFAPGFDWAAFYQGAGVAKAKKLIVSENTAIAKIAEIYGQTPLKTLKLWQVFKTVDQAAPYLSQRFVNAQWAFRSKTLSGAMAQRPRWKRSISVTEDSLGEALGRTYVTAYFPQGSKTQMQALVADLKAAMRSRIEALTWMSAPTKAKALEKLDKFGVKIGYPDKWRDYSALVIKPDDLYGNIERASAFDWAFSLSKLDRPADPDEWGMTPQRVNAYYSPTRNEIVFPAAILQPPFFDPEADKAVNYGAIGGVIGHEITHGFDDQGRNADGDGILQSWWAPDDEVKFNAQAAKLGAQYDAYEPVAGSHIKGAQTMGENIADLGGLLLGLDAYRLSLKGAPAPVIEGLSGDQRVFLGWAQVWRSKMRDDALKQQLASGVHSPPRFRVIGPMRNIDAWYEAFAIKPDDANYLKPEDRVKIW
jgi:putative endopeptidase